MQLLIAVLSSTLIAVATAATCQRPGIPSNETTKCGAERTLLAEGLCLCCFNNSAGIPTIGTGFSLNREDAKSTLRAYGLDVEEVRRDCIQGTTNHCLSNDNAIALFNNVVYPEFRRLADNFVAGMPEQARAAVTDMAFAGAEALQQLRDTDFQSNLQNGYYKNAAQNLKFTKWCREAGERRCISNFICILQCGCRNPFSLS